jgi:glucose-1-phosphate cytidylyltransferase
MKTIILAGGRGTRMGTDVVDIPKPMVTIGGRPMIHHIMNYYQKFGSHEFIILTGYKHEVIEDYFNSIQSGFENVTLLDTGVDTPTGQRLLEAEPLVRDEAAFMLTYGDGLGNVDIDKFTINEGYVGLITAVHPPGRFGTLSIEDNRIMRFDEKQRLESEWVNGGFMFFRRALFKYIERDEMLEFDVFPRLAEEGLLQVYKHEGFWNCMDTPRDREYLEKVWSWKRCFWR